MKRLMFVAGVLLAFTSCGPTQQLISETPQIKREAFVYDNKVVIVTKTTITKDHYDRLIAQRDTSREVPNKN